ncbi:MAG: glycosyltransferase [Acidimicrobiales bacterium]
MVLHLIKSLSGVGGAEQLLLSLTAAGDRKSFEYHVAHVLVAPSGHLVERFEAAGVELHDLGVSTHYDMRWLGRLRRLLVGRRVAILHVHLPYAAGFGRLVAHSVRPRPRVVHTQHNIWGENPMATQVLHRLTCRLDDADIAVSQAAWSVLPPRLRSRTEVVVHGLSMAELDAPRRSRDEIRAEFGLRPGEALVTTVANLRQEKGYDVLLGAARQLLEEGLAARFVAVGAGPLADEVARRRDGLALGDRFVLAGFRADAKEIVAASDLFVLASYHEGFPVAVMEALALGVPVVSTAVGDVPLAIGRTRSGLVVPPGDSSSLAGAMRTLLLDGALREQMAAAALASRPDFDVRRAVGRVEAIYRGLLGIAAPTSQVR